MIISRKATHSWVMLAVGIFAIPIAIGGGVRGGLHQQTFATSNMFVLCYCHIQV